MARLTGTRSGEQQLTGTLTTARMEVTVSVDSETITGAPGSAASVENIGTDRDAILKFTIPRGYKGDTGNPGPAGQDGRDGQDGQDGSDGYSPTVAVTNITGGHRVTITDANGAHTFDVMDGADGQDGSDGQDGQDGTDGTTFTPAVSAAGVISWTNDGGKTNPPSVNIKGPQGDPGADGDDGVTFTPAVSQAGVLSWTNDGGRQNPQSVDITAAVLTALPTWQGGNY